MPRPTLACAGSARRSWSSSRMAPSRAATRPMTERISVVLPAPLWPIIAAITPCGTARSTPWSTGTPAIATSSARISSTSKALRYGPPMGLAADHVLPDLRAGERLGSGRIGDHAAVVEGEHAPGVALDDLHVVLDEQHGQPLARERRHDPVHDRELLVDADAAGRLVEQQQL